MISGIVLYSIALILIIISLTKDRKRTFMALKKSFMIFKNLLPEILAIMLFIGLSLAILTPEKISLLIGEQSGILSVIGATVIGSIALIPSFIVFPLGETLLENGAGYPQVAALVSSLMAIGVISYPMEQKMFGKTFAITRNVGALVFSILFTIIIWVVM